jgi:hypothetical protein
MRNFVVGCMPDAVLLTVFAFVDHEVVACVLAKGNKDWVSDAIKGDDDRELGSLADGFRMLHSFSLPKASAGPCPNQTTQASPTMCVAPE